jgi:hypothetical protein
MKIFVKEIARGNGGESFYREPQDAEKDCFMVNWERGTYTSTHHVDMWAARIRMQEVVGKDYETLELPDSFRFIDFNK